MLDDRRWRGTECQYGKSGREQQLYRTLRREASLPGVRRRLALRVCGSERIVGVGVSGVLIPELDWPSTLNSEDCLNWTGGR